MENHAPILLTAFNRPDFTALALDNLWNQGVRKLYMATDGPRPNHPTDEQNVREVHQIIVNTQKRGMQIIWLKRDQNLGCGRAMKGAIDWFFENVEEGIVLEDDCKPNNSFIPFATAMLQRYRQVNEVMHINGSNFASKKCMDSYYYSALPIIWGWATWRDVWKKYETYIDVNILDDLDNYYAAKTHIKSLRSEFIRTNQGQIDTWDYQYVATIWKYKGISITPCYNLIANIGFHPETATHTKSENSYLSNLNNSLELRDYLTPKDLKINKAIDKTISKRYKDKLTIRKVLFVYISPFLQSRLPWLHRLLKPLAQPLK